MKKKRVIALLLSMALVLTNFTSAAGAEDLSAVDGTSSSSEMEGDGFIQDDQTPDGGDEADGGAFSGENGENPDDQWTDGGQPEDQGADMPASEPSGEENGQPSDDTGSDDGLGSDDGSGLSEGTDGAADPSYTDGGEYSDGSGTGADAQTDDGSGYTEGIGNGQDSSRPSEQEDDSVSLSYVLPEDAVSDPVTADAPSAAAQEGRGDDPEDGENEEPLLQGPVFWQPESLTVIPGGAEDNDALFGEYMGSHIFGTDDAQPLMRGGVPLYGNDAAVYNALYEQIMLVAEGTRQDTVFSFPVEGLYGQTSWTEEELGVPIIENGAISDAATVALYEWVGFNSERIIRTLLQNCPYELYWYDKEEGTDVDFYEIGAEQYSDGEQIITELTISGSVTFSFAVASGYAAGDYLVDPAPVQTAGLAAQNAMNIVRAYAGLSDYKKLCKYKEEICALTDYNTPVLEGEAADSDAWQLVWVFDNDPDTTVVCEGYAKAFQYLFDRSSFSTGLSCRLVTGQMAGGTGSGPHMWNVVTMEDGGNYLVDVTNCDPPAIGADDLLFLAGTDDGDFFNGYTFSCNDSQIVYRYDGETIGYYEDAGILADALGLAAFDYVPGSADNDPRIDYYRIPDSSMMVGETVSIDHYYEAELYDENGLFYGYAQYAVTDVDIIRNTPAEGYTGNVLEQQNDPGEYCWYYSVLCPGEAVLRVTHTDLAGGELYYEFTITAAEDLYGVSLERTDGGSYALPGDMIPLRANGWHRYRDEYETEYVDAEGLDYKWEIVTGSEWAALSVDEYDHSLAALTFMDLPAGQDITGGEVTVGVRVLDENDAETEAYFEESYSFCTEYTAVWPMTVGRGLEVGSSDNLCLETRHYVYGADFNGKNYEVLDGVQYVWTYDETFLRITENLGSEAVVLHNGDVAAGSDFTVTRLHTGEFSFDVSASWTDENDNLQSISAAYDFVGLDYQIRFDESDIIVYADDEEPPVLTLDVSNLGENWADRLDVQLTARAWDTETGDWSESPLYEGPLTESDFTVSVAGADVTLTLPGDYLDTVQENGESVQLAVEVFTKDLDGTGGHILTYAEACFTVCLTNFTLDWQEELKILPGENREISGYIPATVYDGENPGGRGVYFPITGVEIAPGSDEYAVRDLHREEDKENPENYWWEYTAGESGEAVLLVTYEDLTGTENVCELAVTVVNEMYSVSMTTPDRTDCLFPGDSIELSAYGYHTYVNEYGQVQNDFSGFRYQWEIQDYGVPAELTVHDDDPSAATLRFLELPEGEEVNTHAVQVSVRLLDYADNVTDACYASSFSVCTEYTTIWPETLDRRLDVGASLKDLTFEIRHYVYGGDFDGDGCNYEVLDESCDVQYQWQYDPEYVQITEKTGGEDEDGTIVPPGSFSAGNTVSVTRLMCGEFDLNVFAEWTDQDSSYWNTQVSYHFDTRDYSIWFKEDSLDLYTDAEDIPALTLDIGNLGDTWEEKLNVQLTAGVWDDEDGSIGELWYAGPLSADMTEPYFTAAGEAGQISFDLTEDFLDTIGDETVCVRFETAVYQAGVEQSVDSLLGTAAGSYTIYPARTEYSLEENQRILPGETGHIYGTFSAVTYNSLNPSGLYEDMRVTGVEVVSENSDAGPDSHVIRDLERYEYGNGSDYFEYRFTADSPGSAELLVTFTGPDGEERNRAVTIRVMSDIYDLSLYANEHLLPILPGDSIELEAYSWHEYLDEDGNVVRDYDDPDLSYEWEIVSGSDRAEISAHNDDPSKATLTFLPLQAGQENVQEKVTVGARLIDAAGKPTDLYRELSFRIGTERGEVWPKALDSDLAVGESLADQAFEVRRYVPGEDFGGAGYEVIDNVRYEWHYDPDALRLTEKADGGEDEGTVIGDGEASSGNVLTITRLAGRETVLDVNASWQDAEGSWHNAWGRYVFRECPDTLVFDNRHLSINTNASYIHNHYLTITGADAGWTDRLDLELTVGHWNEQEDWFGELWYSGILTGNLSEDEFTAVIGENGGVSIVPTREYLAGQGELREDDHIRVYAALYPKGAERTPENRLSETDAWFHIFASWEDYEYEQDRTMLPGWDGTVNGTGPVWVRNSDHPDGEDMEYYVKNVEVIRDEPAEGEAGPVITDFHRDQDENDPYRYWWYYRVGSMGEADLKVTYTDLRGDEQSYVFTLFVGTDVYNVRLESEGGMRTAFPGRSIELTAYGSHEYFDEEGDYQNDADGLGYEWILEYGGEFAVLNAHPDDPSKATLTFKVLPEGWDEIDERVRVGVKVVNAEEQETEGYCSEEYRVSSDYAEIWPLTLDSDLDAGSSLEDQTFQVRHYALGEDFYGTGHEVLDDLYLVQYEWHFDQNDLRITEKQNGFDGEETEIADNDVTIGSTVTITRQSGRPTNLDVRAFWNDEEGREHEAWGNYRFSGRNYDIGFEEHDIDLFTGETKIPAHMLQLDNLGEDWADLFEIELTVGHWDEDWIGDPWYNGPLTAELQENNFTTSGGDGWITFALTETYLAGLGQPEEDDHIRLYAAVYRKGAEHTPENRLSDADAWFHVRPAQEDYEFEQDRTMLPGWDGTVEGKGRVWVRNSEHPDGEELEYTVTNVEVIRDEPAPGDGGPVIKAEDFHYDEDITDPDHFWWYYRVSSMGQADLKVTYTDLHGAEQSYVFTLYAGTDVYRVYIESEGGVRTAFPGDAIRLTAFGSHEYYDEEGDYQNNADGLGYEWFIEYGGEFAVLEDDPDDPSKATLTFNELPEGWDHIDEGVRVGVKVLDADGQETEGYSSWEYRVSSDYTEIWPILIDSDLDVGASLQDQTFEVRHYVLGEDFGDESYELLDDHCDVRYEWHFDQNALRITEKSDSAEGGVAEISDNTVSNGRTVTITRQTDWRTSLNVKAFWRDREGREREVWSNYQFFDKNYDIWFEDHDLDLFTDEAEIPEHLLDLGNLGGDWADRLEVELTVGHWDKPEGWIGDPWYTGPLTAVPANDWFTVSGGDAPIAFALAETYLAGLEEQEKDDDIRLHAAVYLKGAAHTEENLLSETDAWFHVNAAREEYEFEQDRTMLPGWDGTVDGKRRVRVRNSEHPDGEDREYIVTDVKKISDDPAEGAEGPVIEDLHRDQNENDPDDYWWYYKVGSRGRADMEVTYIDLAGEEKSYVFTLYVGTDVYSVNLDSEGGIRTAFPGDAIELTAYGSHEYYDVDGEYQNDADGLGYEWFLEYGEEFAVLKAHDDDPSKATLTFKALPEGWDEIDEDVRVGVKLLDAERQETEGYCSEEYRVSSDYTEIWPLTLDRDLDVGASLQDQTLEVRHYVLGEDFGGVGYEVLDDQCDVQYEWHFDQNALQIIEQESGNEIPDGGISAGRTVTITRQGDWWTNLNVRAFWEDGEGRERDVWGDYLFFGKDYDIGFEDHDIDLFTDETEIPAHTLRLGNLGGDWADRLEVELTVGHWNEQEDWIGELWYTGSLTAVPENGSFTVTIGDGRASFALTETYLAGMEAQEEDDDIRLFAAVYLKGAEHTPENRLSETDAWFHVNTTREEYEFEQDRTMLPGWEGTVNGKGRVHVRNSEYPDGEELEYTVTNVEILRDEPSDEEEERPVIADWHRDQDENDPDDYWWYYKVGSMGEADLKITYTDLAGEENSYTFTLYVGTDVYMLDLVPDGSGWGLPGDTIPLYALTTHESTLDNVQDDFSYEWTITAGEADGHLTTFDGEPWHADLTFRDMRPDETHMNANVEVEVILYDGVDENGKKIERARARRWLHASDGYYEISPAYINFDLPMGDSQQITAELRLYTADNPDRYSLIDDVQFRWEYVDEEAVEILDANGTKVGNGTVTDAMRGRQVSFTIHRLREWGTGFRLEADFKDPHGREQTDSVGYMLNPVEYAEPTADFTELEKALAAVPADLSRYTPETRGLVESIAGEARDAIERGEQSQIIVDSIAQQLKDAVAGLKVAVTGVKLDKMSLSLVKGNTAVLKATVQPADAADKTVSWKSSDTSIVTVDKNGKVTVNNKGKAGKAKITVTTNSGKKTASCDVMVYFTDVPKTHAFQKAVYWAAELGITGGMGTTGAFGVNENITRGQVVMFLWRAAGKPEPQKSTQTFKDVPTSHAFYKAIQWASEQKITAGYKDGRFGVDDSCTRGQIVTFMWRYAKMYQGAGDPKGKEQVFHDVPVTHSFFKAVQWAYENRVTTGYSNGNFGVDDFCTRGQCVTFLYRVLG